MAARPARAAAGGERRLRHRLPHGELHGAGGGAARDVAPRRLGRRRRWPHGRARASCPRRQRGARVSAGRTATAGHRLARSRAGRRGLTRAHAAGGARRPGGHNGGRTDHRVRAGGQREHGRVRSAGRHRRHHAAPRRVASRRRRIRAVGIRQRGAQASHARRGPSRLVGDRCAQVAQRAVRLGPRVRREPGGASRRHELER